MPWLSAALVIVIGALATLRRLARPRKSVDRCVLLAMGPHGLIVLLRPAIARIVCSGAIASGKPLKPLPGSA